MKFDVPSIVIDKLFSEGYEEQIVDIVMAFENDSEREVSDIPISPTMIDNNNEHIILKPKVFEKYQLMIERIKNPATAQEIPFIMLGNRKLIDGQEYVVFDDLIYHLENAVSVLHTTNSQEEFEKVLSTTEYGLISIGHTHGNVDEKIKDNALARKIPDDLRMKYDIRDTGLNISIADIWQHEAFKQIASGKKEIFQTIVMYNGDMIVLGSNGVSKSVDIHSTLSNGEILSISTGINEELTSKHHL